MAEFDRPTIAAARAGTAAVIDQGLRSYMLKVYNYMSIGLVVTGLVAYGAFAMAFDASGQLTGFGEAIYLSPLKWVVMLAPLAFVLVLSFGINKLSTARHSAVLGVCRRDGPVALVDLLRLYRRLDRQGVLHHRRARSVR